MGYIFAGVLGFILFIVYDINCVKWNNNLLKKCFFFGCFIIICSTIGLTIESFKNIKLNLLSAFIFVVLAIIMFALLIYTLFFALPFDNTYISDSNKICDKGVYALCRHPGVLWFVGFYIFLSCAFPYKQLILGSCIFSFCNFLYILFQDYWTFPNMFLDYQEYKKNVPFLIPNVKSINAYIRSRGEKNEV